MTDLPYTDADLYAEAARQHKELTEDPDFMGVGEQMEGERIPSTVTDPDAAATTREGGRTWDMLAADDFDAANNRIADLIGGAADVSKWAVQLGADGLQPDDHELTWKAGDQPIVRVHFAFHEGLSPEARDHLVAAVGEALQTELADAAN